MFKYSKTNGKKATREWFVPKVDVLEAGKPIKKCRGDRLTGAGGEQRLEPQLKVQIKSPPVEPVQCSVRKHPR